MQAGVVHHEFNFRTEVHGSWAGNTFSYRKGISPHHLSLAATAIVCVALANGSESHIVEGDPSGVVFQRTRFVSKLYARVVARDSPLAGFGQRSRLDVRVWQMVCESAALTVQQRRQASYLCAAVHASRVFYRPPLPFLCS